MAHSMIEYFHSVLFGVSVDSSSLTLLEHDKELIQKIISQMSELNHYIRDMLS